MTPAEAVPLLLSDRYAPLIKVEKVYSVLAFRPVTSKVYQPSVLVEEVLKYKLLLPSGVVESLTT